MHTISKKINVYHIINGSRYIAALGGGVQILDRKTLEIVHQFTGIRYIHGGVFLDENTLAVFTGEQKLFFLDISKKSISWQCPRPRQASSAGKIRFCKIGDTYRVACILEGKIAEERLLMIVDSKSRSWTVKKISNYYRVVHGLMWTPEMGLTFLSSQARGDNRSLCYIICQLKEDGTAKMLKEWTDYRIIQAYTGKHLFCGDYHATLPQLLVYEFNEHKEKTGDVLPHFYRQLNLPYADFLYPFGKKALLPTITWVEEETNTFTAILENRIFIYDFLNNRMLAEYSISDPVYATVIDQKLFVGCTPGLYVEDISEVTSKM